MEVFLCRDTVISLNHLNYRKCTYNKKTNGLGKIFTDVVLNVSVHFLQRLPTCSRLTKPLVQCAVLDKKSYHYNYSPIFLVSILYQSPNFFDVVTRRVLTNAQHLELVSVQIDKTYVVKQ